jgi:hypothetical protein
MPNVGAVFRGIVGWAGWRWFALIAFGVALVVGAILLSKIGTGESANAKAGSCSVENAEGTVGKRVKKPVKLQPAPNAQSRTINFDVNRGEKFTTFVVTAEPAVTEKLKPHLILVADPMVRTGDENAETVLFEDPMFSPLQFSGNNERITFRVCLDPPKDVAAGSYAGIITLDGPAGVEATAVTLIANVKDGSLFGAGLALTAVGAMFLLFYKEAARRRTAAIQAAGTDRDERKEAERWGPHCRDALDFGWFVGTAVAIAAMFGVLYALWENNPSWGDAGFVGSVVALIGAGMAAIGAKEIFSTNRGL